MKIVFFWYEIAEKCYENSHFIFFDMFQKFRFVVFAKSESNLVK